MSIMLMVDEEALINTGVLKFKEWPTVCRLCGLPGDLEARICNECREDGDD